MVYTFCMRRLFFLGTFVLLTLPVLAYAQTGFFGPIVPECNEFAGGVRVCQLCNLVQLADNLLKLFVSLSVGAATLMFAYAGFLYVTAAANQGNIDSAKSIFSNTLIGLIIILVAYLGVSLLLRVLTGNDLAFYVNIQCVQRSTVRGELPTFTGVPATPTVTGSAGGGGAPGSGSGSATGKGLESVDSNTNYNPVVCKKIVNYKTSGAGASCTSAARKADSRVETECMQGCMGSASGKRIITAQEYLYCQKNPTASLSELEQIAPWQSFKAMKCSDAVQQGVTVAIPQGAAIPLGQRFTWPELAERYGLPKDTVFSAEDRYARTCPGGKLCGVIPERNALSVDVARCIYGAPNCTFNSYSSAKPMQTKPTPVPPGG